MNAASQVPSGVLISTFFSTTCCAVTSEPAAAARPAATVIVTKSRRVSSSCDMFLVLSFYRSTSDLLLLRAERQVVREERQHLDLDPFDDAIGVVSLVSLERV